MPWDSLLCIRFSNRSAFSYEIFPSGKIILPLHFCTYAVNLILLWTHSLGLMIRFPDQYLYESFYHQIPSSRINLSNLTTDARIHSRTEPLFTVTSHSDHPAAAFLHSCGKLNFPSDSLPFIQGSKMYPLIFIIISPS